MHSKTEVSLTNIARCLCLPSVLVALVNFRHINALNNNSNNIIPATSRNCHKHAINVHITEDHINRWSICIHTQQWSEPSDDIVFSLCPAWSTHQHSPLLAWHCIGRKNPSSSHCGTYAPAQVAATTGIRLTVLFIYLFILLIQTRCLQCFDAVGGVAWRASGL